MNIEGETIIYEGKKRYYVKNLSVEKNVLKDQNLKNSLPHLLKINDYEISESTWGEMIRNLIIYLLNEFPKDRQQLLNFKTSWSRSDIFSPSLRTNFKQVEENLYVNCNHDAMHSCWLIQEILDFFKIDKTSVFFLIHRTPSSEPKKCREFFKEKFKESFSLFLQTSKGKSKENSNIIIKNIEKMDYFLTEISPSYNSFLLFENYNIFNQYSSRFLEQINKRGKKISENNLAKMKEYIDYLKEFYKILM